MFRQRNYRGINNKKLNVCQLGYRAQWYDFLGIIKFLRKAGCEDQTFYSRNDHINDVEVPKCRPFHSPLNAV